MPLDNLMWADEMFKSRCLGWELKFSLLPRRCFYSNKLIWFKLGYLGTAMVTGPGTPVFEPRWIDRNEFLVYRIKGTI